MHRVWPDGVKKEADLRISFVPLNASPSLPRVHPNGVTCRARQRLWIIATLVGVLCSCSSAYNVSGSNAGSEKLKAQESVYIMLAQDGHYGNTPYPGSGRAASNALTGAFTKFSNRVEQAAQVEDLDLARANAARQNLTYVARPVILNWEDRATEWSGKRDRISIQISVVDVKSGRSESSGVVNGSSKWFTFGGDHPEDLLEEGMNRFVSQLY